MLLITVTRWGVKCSDEYNFDPGKTAFIPGIGQVTDAEMDMLRAAGLAKNFHVDSAPFDAGAAWREDRVRHRGAEDGGRRGFALGRPSVIARGSRAQDPRERPRP